MKKGQIKYKKKIYYNKLFIKIGKIITPFILLFLKTKIEKVRGNIPNKGALLIAAHHEEFADQYIMGTQIKRRLFWVADTTPFGICLADSFFIKWLMLRLGAIPIDKENQKRNINLFDYLLYLLRRGEAIVFFPEAYLRSERKGKKFGKVRDGTIRLALEYEKRFNKKIPVYPLGIKYKKEDNIKKACLKIGKKIIISNKKDKIKVVKEIKKLSS